MFRPGADPFVKGKRFLMFTAVIVIILVMIFVIRADFRLETVEDDTDDSRLDVIYLCLGPLQGAACDLADLVNDDDPVGLGPPDRRIGG